MKINIEPFKKNIYWIISVILFGLVVIFSTVMLITLEISSEADETSIGFIYLGNRSDDEKESLISQGVQSWQDQAQYTLNYQGYQIPINLDMFDFDLENTISSIIPNQNNDAVFMILEPIKELWINDLTSVVGSTVINQFDQSTFFEDVMRDVSSLSRLKVYNFTDYLDVSLQDTVLNVSTLTQISASDVTAIITEVSEISIQGQSRFSLLETMSSKTLSNEQLSIIASGMLDVMKNSHLTSFDFEIYQYLPSWAEQGKNVRILKVNELDLSFYNGLHMDYHILISQESSTSLKFELIGYPFITQYESSSVLKEVIDYQTLIYDDESIDQFTQGVIITETDTEYIYQVIIQTGVNGAIYETSRTITPYQGNPSTIQIFYEHYLPIDEVIHQHIVEKGG